MENQFYDRKVIKDAAKKTYNNDNVRWWIVLVNLVYLGIQSVALSAAGIGIFFVAPVKAGVYYCAKDALKTKKVSLEKIFDGYKGNWLRYVAADVLIKLIVLAGMLLLIVPGVIWHYAYSQTFFILAENPEMTATEAMAKSKEMMVGYKFKLFVLNLSFIGHMLLSAITCGIWGILVYQPYYLLTITNFFLFLKQKQFDDVEVIE